MLLIASVMANSNVIAIDSVFMGMRSGLQLNLVHRLKVLYNDIHIKTHMFQRLTYGTGKGHNNSVKNACTYISKIWPSDGNKHMTRDDCLPDLLFNYNHMKLIPIFALQSDVITRQKL